MSALSAAGIIAAGVSSAHGQPTFQSLGDLTGGLGAFPQSMSSNGAVIVGFDYYIAPGGLLQNHAFVWTSGSGMQAIFAGDLDYTSAAFAISADGLHIGGWHALTIIEERAFVWSAATGERQLATRSGVKALSANGAIAAGYLAQGSGATGRAATWDASGHATFIDLSNMSASQARGVSADGSVVVGWGAFNSSMIRAFRWTGATGMINIGDTVAGGPESHANAITPDGTIIVGDAQSSAGALPVVAAMWNGSGGMQLLGTLPGDSAAEAYAVSADGHVVVGTSSIGSSSRAFVWRAETGMLDLRTILGSAVPAGWTLTEARAVSADGLTIAGSGFGPSSSGAEAWIATLPPCLPGDLNGDGFANGADIQLFVNAIATATQPPSVMCAADLDRNGVVDLNDVPLFVSAILHL